MGVSSLIYDPVVLDQYHKGIWLEKIDITESEALLVYLQSKVVHNVFTH